MTTKEETYMQRVLQEDGIRRWKARQQRGVGRECRQHSMEPRATRLRVFGARSVSIVVANQKSIRRRVTQVEIFECLAKQRGSDKPSRRFETKNSPLSLAHRRRRSMSSDRQDRQTTPRSLLCSKMASNRQHAARRHVVEGASTTSRVLTTFGEVDRGEHKIVNVAAF